MADQDEYMKPEYSGEKEAADRQLMQEQFTRREFQLSHLAFEREFAFYRAVRDGDEEAVLRMMLPLQNEGLGHLSDHKVRNLRYHLIITIALLTRFCIEGGMLPETAYSLSDVYIQRSDRLEREEDITALHREVIEDFTRRMKSLRHQSPYSKQVEQIMDYVYAHLHEKIELAELATALGYNKTYLCDLFHRETGFTIGNYILRCKVEAAENMLRYSEYSGSEIANYLGFASHSHFIESFKKITGMTPTAFRRKAGRSWSEEHTVD